MTLAAPPAGGRTLTPEAVGRVEDEYTCGVREVRVHDGEKLVQTVLSREVPIREIRGETASHYTEIWELKDGGLKLTGREEYFDEEQPE